MEMVSLSTVARDPARIAAHLGNCTHTVRGVLKDFQAPGTAALFPQRTGPPPDLDRHRHVTELLQDLLGEDRTWISRRLAAALAEQGVALSARHVRRYFGMLGAGWRREKSKGSSRS